MTSNSVFVKIPQKTSNIGFESHKDLTSLTDDLSRSYGRGTIYKPSNTRKGGAVEYYSSRESVSVSVRKSNRGVEPMSAFTYPTGAVWSNPLSINVIVPGGGTTNAIAAEGIATDLDFSELGSLLALDYTLETLLYLTDNGPTTLKTIAEELVPKDRIVSVLSELRRNDLIEIYDNLVSPTQKARKVTDLLRKKLDAPHEAKQSF